MEEAKIRSILEEVINDARKKFWVDPETHFLHHKEMEGWIRTFGLVRKSVIVSFITGVVAGLIGIFWLGMAAYMKLKAPLGD